jgi:hypothetical protein
MQHSPSVPWRALRAALGLGAAALVSLALAGVASAQNVIGPITPDGSAATTDNLATAINTANTNSASSNTIVLSPGVYTPGDDVSTTDVQPFTITKNLTIAGPHNFQAAAGGPANDTDINGALAGTHATNALFIINPGVTLTLEGLQFDVAGAAGFPGIQDNGNLVTYGVTWDGSPSQALDISGTGTATLNDTTVDGTTGDSIELTAAGASLTTNNTTIAASNGASIDLPASGYTLNLNNTVLAFSVAAECNGGTGSTNGGPGSTDDDGTCHTQFSDNTGLDSQTWSPAQNGGPAETDLQPAGNTDESLKGVNCPPTDGRFFANPVVNGVTQCDIGATTAGATQETAGPKCTVTGGSAGPPASQQVSLVDASTGVGPESGDDTDNPSNTVATAYPPPAAVPVPGDSISNMQISNGTVAAPTPLAEPSTAAQVVTATKTTAGQLTHWSFTGLNWAGVATNCF